jgi:hypothetical protein
MKAHWVGFSRKNCFKKWRKKIYLSTMDAMTRNGLVVLNDSVKVISLNQPHMKRHELYQCCAQRMMSHSDPNKKSVSLSKLQVAEVHGGTNVHVPLAIRSGIPCVVGHLQTGAWLGGNTISMVGLQTNIVNCSHCNNASHNCIPIMS